MEEKINTIIIISQFLFILKKKGKVKNEEKETYKTVSPSKKLCALKTKRN